jgi:hypothetical protein
MKVDTQRCDITNIRVFFISAAGGPQNSIQMSVTNKPLLRTLSRCQTGFFPVFLLLPWGREKQKQK